MRSRAPLPPVAWEGQNIRRCGPARAAECRRRSPQGQGAGCAARSHWPLLRISTAYSFGRLHLGAAIAAFARQHPELTFEVTFENRWIDLVEEGVDLAIRIGRLADSSLISRQIAPCRMVMCASPEYLKHRGVPRKIEDLADHNCLDYQFADPVGRWPLKGSRSVPVHGSVKSNSGDLLRTLALNHHGIVRLPSFLVGEDLLAARLTPLFLDRAEPEIAIHAVHPHSRLVPAKVRAFVDFLISYFGSVPAWDRWLEGGRDPIIRR